MSFLNQGILKLLTWKLYGLEFAVEIERMEERRGGKALTTKETR